LRLRIQNAKSTEIQISATPPTTLPAITPVFEVPPPLSPEGGGFTTEVDVSDVVAVVVAADVVVVSAVVVSAVLDVESIRLLDGKRQIK
jgi:hypothetical protein